MIDIESLTKEIEEPTVVHEVISLNEDPEILSPTEPTLQEMQEITLVTEDSEITDSTTILIEEKMTEEPQDTSEENISSENDKTQKKDDNDTPAAKYAKAYSARMNPKTEPASDNAPVNF